MNDNIMRQEYRPLTDDEKARMKHIKDSALSLHEYIRMMGPSRECSLAMTKIEEAVMWATKHITK